MATYKKIIRLLKERNEPLTQREISRKVRINRAVLLGYLRCLVDMRVIRSKNSGRAKVYFL